MSKSWYLVWCWSSPKWSKYLFELGRKDTLDNMQKIDTILNRSKKHITNTVN